MGRFPKLETIPFPDFVKEIRENFKGNYKIQQCPETLLEEYYKKYSTMAKHTAIRRIALEITQRESKQMVIVGHRHGVRGNLIILLDPQENQLYYANLSQASINDVDLLENADLLEIVDVDGTINNETLTIQSIKKTGKYYDDIEKHVVRDFHDIKTGDFILVSSEGMRITVYEATDWDTFRANKEDYGNDYKLAPTLSILEDTSLNFTMYLVPDNVEGIIFRIFVNDFPVKHVEDFFTTSDFNGPFNFTEALKTVKFIVPLKVYRPSNNRKNPEILDDEQGRTRIRISGNGYGIIPLETGLTPIDLKEVGKMEKVLEDTGEDGIMDPNVLIMPTPEMVDQINEMIKQGGRDRKVKLVKKSQKPETETEEANEVDFF